MSNSIGEHDLEGKLNDLFQGERGNSYAVPTYFTRGGTRHLAKIRWGPTKDEVRVAKVDAEPVSPRAQRHVERGYTTAHELDLVSGIKHPGITRLLDYFPEDVAGKYGVEGPVTVEEFFEDSVSLEEYVGEKGLSDEDIKSIFYQVIGTIRDINNGEGVSDGYGLWHRDLKPSNILIRKKNKRLEVKVGDWANACRVGESTRKYNPSGGGIQTEDPLLMSPLTGEEAAYSSGSEVYALTQNLAIAIRGKPITHIDPDKGEAIEVDTGESLLNEEGKLDKDKYEEALKRAIKNLPRKFRKYADILEEGLTLTPHRTRSTVTLYNKFNHAASQPSLKQSLKYWGIGLAAGAAVVAGLFGYSLQSDANRSLEKTLAQERIEKEYSSRLKAIDLWLMARSNTNLINDPENRREIFFTRNTNDFFEDAEMRAWLSLFYEFDTEKEDFVGDYRTAFASYLDCVDNGIPDVVFTGLMTLNGIEDREELVKRIIGRDRTLNVNYDELEPIIEKLDETLYWKVYGVNNRYIDNWMLTVHGEQYDKTREKIRAASDMFDLRERRKAMNIELGEFQKKFRRENKSQLAPSVGDIREMRLEDKLRTLEKELRKKYNLDDQPN